MGFRRRVYAHESLPEEFPVFAAEVWILTVDSASEVPVLAAEIWLQGVTDELGPIAAEIWLLGADYIPPQELPKPTGEIWLLGFEEPVIATLASEITLVGVDALVGPPPTSRLQKVERRKITWET